MTEPICTTCGKPMPYGEFIIMGPQHKKCVDMLRRQVTGERR